MSSDLGIPLSVLDLAPVAEGSTPGDALRNTLDLSPRAEALGFTRYWVAEHHNMPGIASSAPAVLLAHIGSVTSTIRIGSGGVMLPNHSSLVIAEQFGMLEALHPGRVDLGLGRAPGTDQLTARALRRIHLPGRDAEDFPNQLVELFGYFDGAWPEGHPYSQITATPGRDNKPAVWMLGSSDFGAEVAGYLGLPYSFAHHFSGQNTMAAIATYRESFREGGAIDKPYVMLGVNVICAETEERAKYLAGSGLLSFVRLRSGQPGRFPSPETAAEHEYTPFEQALIQERTSSSVVGDPASVKAQLADLVQRTGADELIITTMIYDHAERVRSFELLAEATGLEPLTAS